MDPGVLRTPRGDSPRKSQAKKPQTPNLIPPDKNWQFVDSDLLSLLSLLSPDRLAHGHELNTLTLLFHEMVRSFSLFLWVGPRYGDAHKGHTRHAQDFKSSNLLAGSYCLPNLTLQSEC